jgi:hypothetical protein
VLVVKKKDKPKDGPTYPHMEGKQLWKLRKSHGRNKIFETPEDLLEKACEYFEWCDDNPLYEFDYRGKDIIPVNIPKMRPYTQSGLDIFLGISSLQYYRAGGDGYEEYKEVVGLIDNIIYTQKFEGAAVGFFHHALIARDLGMADKKELSGDGGGPIKTETTLEAGPGISRVLQALERATSGRSGDSDEGGNQE